MAAAAELLATPFTVNPIAFSSHILPRTKFLRGIYRGGPPFHCAPARTSVTQNVTPAGAAIQAFHVGIEPAA